jgi:hypothetical protein
MEVPGIEVDVSIGRAVCRVHDRLVFTRPLREIADPGSRCRILGDRTECVSHSAWRAVAFIQPEDPAERRD